MIAVADTGFVVAAANPRDKHHRLCLEVYDVCELIYLPQSVLTETAFVLTLKTDDRRTSRFLREIALTRYELITLNIDDLARISHLMIEYLDSRLDFVDISVAVIADRLNVSRILTIDRRDFSIIRPRHAEYFELLPEQL